MAYPTSVNSQITDAAAPTTHFPTSKLIEMMINLSYSNLISNTNMSQQNAVANQQSVNETGISITGAAAKLLGKDQ
jgi:hypothetical protein